VPLRFFRYELFEDILCAGECHAQITFNLHVIILQRKAVCLRALSSGFREWVEELSSDSFFMMKGEQNSEARAQSNVVAVKMGGTRWLLLELLSRTTIGFFKFFPPNTCSLLRAVSSHEITDAEPRSSIVITCSRLASTIGVRLLPSRNTNPNCRPWCF